MGIVRKVYDGNGIVVLWTWKRRKKHPEIWPGRTRCTLRTNMDFLWSPRLMFTSFFLILGAVAAHVANPFSSLMCLLLYIFLRLWPFGSVFPPFGPLFSSACYISHILRQNWVQHDLFTIHKYVLWLLHTTDMIIFLCERSFVLIAISCFDGAARRRRGFDEKHCSEQVNNADSTVICRLWFIEQMLFPNSSK